MSERGFLLAGPMLYAAVGAGIVIALLAGALKIQTSRLETCRTEFATFKMETKRIGEAQDKANKEKEQRDKQAKEATDARHKASVARLNRDLKRMRDERSRSGALSAVPADSSRPDTACFSRERLERAVSGFVEGTATLIGRGQQAVEDLGIAADWAQSLR